MRSASTPEILTPAIEKRGFQTVKRWMDVAGSLAGLAVTGLLYLPIAVAIKVDSPGPVVYSQERVGKDERPFKVYKFRTMHVDSCGHGLKPGPEDERVTRVGRFLRRSSLDELPQFLNVFRGEMSLVGPRPEQWAFKAHYQDWQRRRFEVKPGLTGWWQVNGRKQPMHQHIDEDIYYVDHYCLSLDLKILLRTFMAVLNGHGAV
jgi:lipopolysaccharide/colanic/teichoic acid biosynthesis glycosyltransferase